jgi:RNA polymerase sigma factor for flagellar operon FliA
MESDEKFVEKYENFVKTIAANVKEGHSLDTELEDLVASGYRGLLEAKERFDSSKGVTFRTFAYYRVRGAVLDGVRKSSYMPRRAYARLKAAEVLDGESEAISETLAATPEMRSDIAANVRAIDAILGRVAAAYSLAGAAAEFDDRENTLEEDLISRETKNAAIQAIDTLPERERILIRGVYLEERPMDDLAKELGLSKSWVSRLHSRALDILREMIDR